MKTNLEFFIGLLGIVVFFFLVGTLVINSYTGSNTLRRITRSLLLAVLFWLLPDGWVVLNETGLLARRPRLDGFGNKVFTPDGRLVMELYRPTELRDRWTHYTTLGLSVFFLLRTAVIRLRPSSIPQSNEHKF